MGFWVVRRTKRLWTDEEKRSICVQTTAPDVSVAQVARRYALNANVIFKWFATQPGWSGPRRRVSCEAALLAGVGGATVARNMSLPSRIPAAGLVILRDGTPGEPEVSLSPLTYHYDHEAVVEVIVQVQSTQDSMFESLCVAIGQRLAANRTLGGLCDWLEGAAPDPTEIIIDSGEPKKGSAVTITLTCSTTNLI